MLTQQVGDWTRVGGLVHPDGLVPVDDVAGQGEVVQPQYVRVSPLRPHKHPIRVHSCKKGMKSPTSGE